MELLCLDNGTLRCELLTFGATLRALEAPGRRGRRVDVVLGYEELEDYLRWDGYLGAVVGRCANRIAGGRFTLGGRAYTLAVNSGPNHLHGGRVGFSHRVWRVERLEGDLTQLSLRRDTPATWRSGRPTGWTAPPWSCTTRDGATGTRSAT